jgi:L-iditol 2-dehydrogenase
MVYRLPDSVSFEVGAMAEPLAAAVQPIEELTSFNVGDTVLVSGPGPIGLLCLTLLVHHGCRVIVAGARADALRLGVAQGLGAAVTVDVTSESLKDVVDRETAGRGVDAVVEASGAEEAVVQALRCLRKRGKFVQVGICGRDISLPYDQLLYKQIQFFGSVGHSLSTWDRVMRILAAGTVDLQPLVSHVLPLSRWREGFDLCENKRGVKVLIHYDEG